MPGRGRDRSHSALPASRIALSHRGTARALSSFSFYIADFKEGWPHQSAQYQKAMRASFDLGFVAPAERERLGCFEIFELSWRPIPCIRTLAVVTADEVSDKLQLSGGNVSEANAGPVFLIHPSHNTGHFDS